MRTDKLPERGAYVLNLDDGGNFGTHWTAVFEDEYYDSYGLGPPEKLSHLILANTLRHQVREDTCGYWACMFILLRSRGISAYDICYKLMRRIN